MQQDAVEIKKKTPLPLYLALNIHFQTRSRSLIDKFHHLGLCISYDKLLRLSSELAKGVSECFAEIDVVCPPQLKKDIFTTAACDNIDHNPSSRTATESFHGTGISLIQHPDPNFTWAEDGYVSIRNSATSRSIPPLPESYSNVPPVTELPKNYIASPTVAEMQPTKNIFLVGKEKRVECLQHLHMKIDKSLESDLPVAWGAYNACKNQDLKQGICVSSLLPLFPDAVHSPSMIAHAMNMVMKPVNYLNPGQVPVITFDQLLFAIAKQVQWQFSDLYGEDLLVIVLGGLHIKLAS